MNYETILYHKDKTICTITLNRPEVYNAINNQIADELLAGLLEAEKDEEVRVIVLTGSGKAFCSGADLKAPEARQGKPYSEIIHRNYIPLVTKLRNLPKPVICRLNGIAAGAGCSLALACDMIIADEEAVLTELFIGIGLVPDAGSTYFLRQLFTRNKAFELASKATRLTAKEAQEMGVVNRAVPADKLDETIAEETAYFGNAPTKAIAMIKNLLNQAYNSDLHQILEAEAKCQDVASKTKDHMEGVMAFLQKRSPEFKGK